MIAVSALTDKAFILEEPQVLTDISLGGAKSFEQLPNESLALEQHANDEQAQRMRNTTQNSRRLVSML
jgi:hypothetical protein